MATLMLLTWSVQQPVLWSQMQTNEYSDALKQHTVKLLCVFDYIGFDICLVSFV